MIEIVRLFSEAIDLEIEAVLRDLRERGADQPIRIKGVQQVGQDSDGFLYIAKGIAERQVAEDTPLVMTATGTRYRGHLTEHDHDQGEFHFTLLEDAGDSVAQAELEFDTTFLLQSLKEFIESAESVFGEEGGLVGLRALKGIRLHRVSSRTRRGTTRIKNETSSWS